MKKLDFRRTLIFHPKATFPNDNLGETDGAVYVLYMCHCCVAQSLLAVGNNATFTWAQCSELCTRIVPRIAILEIALLEIAVLEAKFQTLHILVETGSLVQK